MVHKAQANLRLFCASFDRKYFCAGLHEFSFPATLHEANLENTLRRESVNLQTNCHLVVPA